MDNTSSTIQFLVTRFQGRVFIPFTEGAEVLGLAPQTARNKLSLGKFPLPTVLHGSRRVIHIEDLANYIDKIRGATALPPKVRRGRPSKASVIERRAAMSYRVGETYDDAI